MSNVAAPSEAGSPADLEVALEAAVTLRLLLPDQWALEGLEVPVEEASVVASVAASTVAEVVAASEEASQTVEVMAEVAVVALATKGVEACVALTDTAPLQMLQLDQEDHARVVLEALQVAMVAEAVDMGALDRRIATAVVGMTRAVVVAHMMTDPADTVAAAIVDLEIAMRLLEVSAAATWSR